MDNYDSKNNSKDITVKEREKAIYRVTAVGSVVNLILVIFKFLAGYLGRSSAMVADAVHSLSDFATDVIVVVFVRIAGKPQDEDHDYGHGKFETLATLIIGIILLGVGIGVCINGIELIIRSLKGEELPRPGMIALIVAIASIVFKEALYHYTILRGKKLNSQSVIANAWHHRSDAISSLGTLIGIAGAMYLGEHWRILDPIAAVVVSFFIMKVALQISKPCIDELLERSLPHNTEEEILQIINGIEGVKAVHHLRTRRIGNTIAIEAHVKMDGHQSLDEAHTKATRIEHALREKYGNATHVGIHMEPYKHA